MNWLEREVFLLITHFRSTLVLSLTSLVRIRISEVGFGMYERRQGSHIIITVKGKKILCCLGRMGIDNPEKILIDISIYRNPKPHNLTWWCTWTFPKYVHSHDMLHVNDWLDSEVQFQSWLQRKNTNFLWDYHHAPWKKYMYIYIYRSFSRSAKRSFIVDRWS